MTLHIGHFYVFPWLHASCAGSCLVTSPEDAREIVIYGALNLNEGMFFFCVSLDCVNPGRLTLTQFWACCRALSIIFRQDCRILSGGRWKSILFSPGGKTYTIGMDTTQHGRWHLFLGWQWRKFKFYFEVMHKISNLLIYIFPGNILHFVNKKV